MAQAQLKNQITDKALNAMDKVLSQKSIDTQHTKVLPDLVVFVNHFKELNMACKTKPGKGGKGK